MFRHVLGEWNTLYYRTLNNALTYRQNGGEMEKMKTTKYEFKDGHVCTSKLGKDELLKRMNRLDVLRILTEGYECGTGKEICKKVIRAYNKEENFTGIIRLNLTEKNFLGYCLENDRTEKEIETIKFYLQ